MRSAKYVCFWLGIITTVAFLYNTSARVMPSFLDSSRAHINGDPSTIQGKGVVFRKSKDGHFYVAATINGENITFLVDTGATDVILSEQDARRIGAHMRTMQKLKTYNTANGPIRASNFSIPEIRVAMLVARNVSASISTTQLQTSLLGMSFLKHFQFIMQNDELILYPSG